MDEPPRLPLEVNATIAPEEAVSHRTAAVDMPSQVPSRVVEWVHRLGQFALGQGAVQFLQLLNGFLLIHWLSLENYAIFTLAAGFQGTAAVLIELGLGGAIIALLAGRKDPEVVGRYIRATRHFRQLFWLILAPLVAAAFAILAARQGISWTLTLLLLAGMLTSLYFEGWTVYYSAPLILHQRLGALYRTPAATGLARLLANTVLFFTGILSALSALWVTALAVIAQGWFYRRAALPHLDEPAESDAGTRAEVLGYIRPLIPANVFFALQGQITVVLVSWFGQGRSIAEVGALGRLGQVFLILSALNTVIIAPRIAAMPAALLARRYLQMLAAASAVALGIMALSWVAPEPLLWILGAKYSHLQEELSWMLGSACLSYVAGVMWTMHAARQWVFAWGVWAYIGTVIAAQIPGLLFMDFSTTRGVLVFAVLGSAATLLVQIGWALYGFSREVRREEHV